jgi:hypothetical protein
MENTTHFPAHTQSLVNSARDLRFCTKKSRFSRFSRFSLLHKPPFKGHEKSENFKVDRKLYILEYCDISITFDAVVGRFRKQMKVGLRFL